MIPPSRPRVDAGADLVAALRRGDAHHVEQLVERHGAGVYRLAMRVLGVSEDAEAAAGDALKTAASRIDTYVGDLAFGAWVDRIAAAAAYRALRERHPNGGEIALDDVLPAFAADGRHFGPMADWSGRVGDGPLQHDLQRTMTEAIASLPADYRAALVLHDVEGVASLDIAAALGIGEPGVRARVHRARLFVRRRLSNAVRPA